MEYPGYTHIKSYCPDDILKLVGSKNEFIEVVIDGIKNQVHLTSLSLQCLKRSRICIKCGLEGTIMNLDMFGPGSDKEGYYFHLYAVFEGELRLMTKDHIVPKSKGGTNHLGNLQTMCDECNNKKSNKLNIEQFNSKNKFGETLNITLI